MDTDSPIIKIIRDKSVIVQGEMANEIIRNYYNQFRLILADAMSGISLIGFPMNRKLDEFRKSRLILLNNFDICAC